MRGGGARAQPPPAPGEANHTGEKGFKAGEIQSGCQDRYASLTSLHHLECHFFRFALYPISLTGDSEPYTCRTYKHCSCPLPQARICRVLSCTTAQAETHDASAPGKVLSVAPGGDSCPNRANFAAEGSPVFTSLSASSPSHQQSLQHRRFSMGQDTSTARRNMALLDTSAVRRSMTLDTSPGRSTQHLPPSSPSRLLQLAPGLHGKTSEKDFLRLAPTAEGSGSEGGNGAAAAGQQQGDIIRGSGGHGGMAVGQTREGSFGGGGCVPRTFSLLSLPQQNLEAEPGSAFPLSGGPDASVRPPSFNLNRGASSLMLSALIGGGGGGGSYAQLADAALGGSGTPPVVPAGGAARPQSLRSAAATAATWRPEALLKLLATPSDPVR